MSEARYSVKISIRQYKSEDWFSRKEMDSMTMGFDDVVEAAKFFDSCRNLIKNYQDKKAPTV